MRTSIFLAILASSLLFAVISPAQGQDCVSPADVGHCKARKLRWYFDVNTQKCNSFYYGGCGGNGNNYLTLQECKEACEQ
ncbi:PI-stichotoxin-Hcr2o-like [Gastrophryne carolinensis]